MTTKKTETKAISKILSSDLAVVKNQNELVKQFKQPGIAKEILDAAELEFSELVQDQDVTTDKGRKKILADATKMVTLKTTVTGIIKERYLDKVNAEKNIVTKNRAEVEAGLDVFRDKIKKPLIEYREKQAKHIADCESRIESLKALGRGNDGENPRTLETLKTIRESLKQWNIDPEVLKEFTDEAQEALDAAIESNAEHIATEEKRIADFEELERLRIENERIRAEAERKEQERLKAEKIRLAGEAEERRIQQEQFDKLKKENEEREAEIERLKKVEADRIDQEKKRILQEEIDAANKVELDSCVEKQHANIQSESKPPEDVKEVTADNDTKEAKTSDVAKDVAPSITEDHLREFVDKYLDINDFGHLVIPDDARLNDEALSNIKTDFKIFVKGLS